jgi:hypothetical protein
MKTRIKQISIAIVLVLLFSGVVNAFAGNDNKYFTVSGVVKDKTSKKKLEYVNISVPGTNMSSITNEDGEFVLKIKDSIRAKEIEFSRIGYFSTTIPLNGNDLLDQR